MNSISVVIASGAGGEFIFRCLDSLRNQVTEHHAEVIVVDRCGGETLTRLKTNYPWVKIIAAEKGKLTSVPQLRALGATHATGDILAVIEEHCVATQDWIKVIQSNFQETDSAIGGPILDANYKHWVDWVVYLSEYHNYIPPWSAGERYMLNGANIAYKRDNVLQYAEVLSGGYWEVVLHPLLAGMGKFRSIPEMGVYHDGPFSYKYYLGQRYLLSRVWGGAQREKVGALKRITYLITAPFLPVLLLLRIASKVSNNKQYLTKFLVTLPMMVVVTMIYVIGEWQGYLVGYGDALVRVE